MASLHDMGYKTGEARPRAPPGAMHALAMQRWQQLLSNRIRVRSEFQASRLSMLTVSARFPA